MACRRNKRNSTSARAFEAYLEQNLRALRASLLSGHYKPGPSTCFIVTHPKAREVWAADFPDRVVHHLFYNKVAQRFINGFIHDSCACIPGRGTLFGAKRLEHHIRAATANWKRDGFYLKMDLANFFVSIDKHVLRAQLARKIKEPWWMALADTILFHDPRTDFVFRGNEALANLVPDHKRLFNAGPDTGLPIGNLSSQFFANVLLNDLDQFVKHRLKVKHYVRYVDDFVLLGESTQELNAHREAIEAFVWDRLKLRVNTSKTVLQPISRGVDFVGHVIKPWRRIVRRKSVRTASRRIAAAAPADLYAMANSYFGLFRQSPASHTDRAHLANQLRSLGMTVKADFTKTYRRSKTPGGQL